MASDSLRRSTDSDKCATHGHLHTPDLRLQHASAIHRSTLGVVKVVAAACDLSPSRIYNMTSGAAPSHGELFERQMLASLHSGKDESDAFAQLRLILNRLGFEQPARRKRTTTELASATAALSREAGELIAAIIEAKRDGMDPVEWEAIKREASELQAALNEVLLAGEQEVNKPRAIRPA